jgi:hypothetical protein
MVYTDACIRIRAMLEMCGKGLEIRHLLPLELCVGRGVGFSKVISDTNLLGC